jgi:hypothetical protein
MGTFIIFYGSMANLIGAFAFALALVISLNLVSAIRLVWWETVKALRKGGIP